MLILRRWGYLIDRAATIAVCMVGMVVLCGCPANLNRVPGSTEKWTDPQTGGKYLLYVPSWHNNDQSWPLVVTCHGTEYFDTADLQLLEWRKLAETVGFIVVAPRLKGTSGMGLRTRNSQIAAQRDDEKLILNVVRRTISALSVDPDRVYIVGWSGGAYAVYHTGLRNPSVFRAAATRMGTFNAKYLPDLADHMDPYQPVGIFFASTDMLPRINRQCRQACEHLKSLGFNRAELREVAGGHRRRPDIAFKFFKRVTEKYAHIRLNAVTAVGSDPLAVQFYLSVDPPARGVLWDFGDGGASTDASPRHRYAKPGSYIVTARIVTSRSARTERKMRIDVGTEQ